ncbi:hypothetical protein [Acetobacter sp.]|uniref:hypothetical protein n=1 Tax=Acetobacter sp. TaxID=440 RepID=UPI0039E89AD9
MVRVHKRFRLLAQAALMTAALGPLGFIAGCSSEDTMMAFPPYQYGYLNQLHLNVATLQTADKVTPGAVPGDESGMAPIPPDQALLQMAQQRIVAAGNTGSALFTVDRASIVHEPGGTLAGRMDTHLDILSSTNQQLGEVEAHVTREMKPDLSKGDADSRANLYELTRQMMQDMNVELEFQIRHNLKDWLVDAGGTPTAAAIQTESLGGSASSPAPAVSSSGSSDAAQTTKPVSSSAPAAAPTAAAITRAPDSEPDAIFPGGGDSDDTSSNTTTQQKRSPPSGYLKLPGSTATQ